MNSYDKPVNDEDLIIFSPIFTFRRNKIILGKDSNYNNLKVRFHKKLISGINQNNLEILENKIKNYLFVMNSKCKNFNSALFFKNFSKTWFNLKNLDGRLINGIDGSIKLSNYFNILELKRLSAIYHEFLHFSSLKNDKKIFAPFNEGYTQLLEERYFNEADPAYYWEVKIMNIIELIYGKDELEKLYFSGNFDQLVNFLNNIIDNQELIFFYRNLDYIYKIENYYKIIERKNLFQDCINNVFRTLLSCYLDSNNLKDINQLKNIFCFSTKYREGDIEEIIYSLSEIEFKDIIEKHNNKKEINR